MGRKRADIDEHKLIRLNSLGLTLEAMGEAFNCNFSTIAHRLRELGIETTDSRRAFSDAIFKKMTEEQIEWIASKLNASTNIHDLVRSTLIDQFIKETK